jgi:hypothetical protein
MGGDEVYILEETCEVSFSGLLESEKSGTLESEIITEIRSDFTDESYKGELSNEEWWCDLLETPDLSESDSAWSESVGPFDTTSSHRCSFLGLLLSNVLSWSLATSVLSSCLLCTSHFYLFFEF